LNYTPNFIVVQKSKYNFRISLLFNKLIIISKAQTKCTHTKRSYFLNYTVSAVLYWDKYYIDPNLQITHSTDLKSNPQNQSSNIKYTIHAHRHPSPSIQVRRQINSFNKIYSPHAPSLHITYMSVYYITGFSSVHINLFQLLPRFEWNGVNIKSILLCFLLSKSFWEIQSLEDPSPDSNRLFFKTSWSPRPIIISKWLATTVLSWIYPATSIRNSVVARSPVEYGWVQRL